MAKGAGTQRSNPRQQRSPTQSLPPRETPPPSNEGIRLFIASLAVASGTVALNESGMHGWPLFVSSIAFTGAAIFFAIFFNRIVDWYPRLELPRRLKVIGQPKAYFVLFCVALGAIWLFGLYSRVTNSDLGGFYIAQERQSETQPFIPTHARIRFREETPKGKANGKQENIWF